MSEVLRARRPIEPPPTPWELPSPAIANEDGIVGVGADLEPGTVLAAYRAGMFPMPLRRNREVAWWSPDPRGVLPLDALRVTRSMRQSAKRYEVRRNTAFAEVLANCADRRRPGAWIDKQVTTAYLRLHELGWAHSFETYDPDGRLVGGLYGIAIGGFFAGESMFHHARDASKVALMALVSTLLEGGAVLLDVQWTTDHLRSLGAIDVPRPVYLQHLAAALTQPLPEVFRS